MVESEYSTGDYESPEISIGAIMKNSEMLKFAPYHLSKHVVKKLSFVTIYVPD